MDAYILDLILRSRPTILEILADRGYDITSYKDVAPEEIHKLATTNQDLLTISANHTEKEESRIVVRYFVEYSIRLKLDQVLEALLHSEESTHNPATDEYIIILSEPFHEIFNIKAARAYNNGKHRISFFNMKNLVHNPARHAFVPPHRKLLPEEIPELVSGLHMKSKHELPHIKFHVDMQARVLGLVPGDVVEIKRPSETAGEYVMYRICSA